MGTVVTEADREGPSEEGRFGREMREGRERSGLREQPGRACRGWPHRKGPVAAVA